MKRLNKKDKKLRGEKWADWIRNIRDDISAKSLLEYMSFKKRGLQVDYPEKFLVMFELRKTFDLARKEVNQKDYNMMYHQKDSFLYDPTIPKKKVDVLCYQVLVEICEKFKRFFVSDKVDQYILEFDRIQNENFSVWFKSNFSFKKISVGA